MPTKQEQLKSILQLLGTSVTKQEVMDAFKTLVGVVRELKQSNAQEFALMKSAISMMGDKLAAENKDDVAAIKKEVTTQVQKALKEQENGMKFIYDKVARLEDGEDGEDGKTPTKEELLALIQPLIPQVKDGQDAVVDHEAIVATVLEKIPKQPVGRIGWGAHPLVIQSSTATVEKVARNIKFTGATVTRGSDGVVTVAVSASGITELTATETPNGNTKVFTFAAASAKPSYVVSDNVWQKATSKAGTVNWTWNAGAKQVTMTVAPQDDIYSIV